MFSQVVLVVSISCTSWVTTLGYGKHIWDIPFEQLVRMPLVANVGGSASTLAAVWSKTSFAITLLRISQGWVKKLIWFIIVSMNLFMGISALMVWIQCTPIQKTWDLTVPGYCWPIRVLIVYDTFSAGTIPPAVHSRRTTD